MSLLPTKTIASKIIEMQNENLNFEQFLKSYLERSIKAVWEDPDFSPQQVLDGFDTSATSLFQGANTIVQLIHIAEPDYQPPETRPVTFNQDGTVTVSN